MGPAEIKFIRETFKLSQRELAKALNVAPFTVARWEAEDGNAPTGLQEEVLRALHNTALSVRERKDDAAAKAIGGAIALGIGALIFYLLTREQPQREAAPRAAEPPAPPNPEPAPAQQRRSPRTQ